MWRLGSSLASPCVVGIRMVQSGEFKTVILACHTSGQLEQRQLSQSMSIQGNMIDARSQPHHDQVACLRTTCGPPADTQLPTPTPSSPCLKRLCGSIVPPTGHIRLSNGIFGVECTVFSSPTHLISTLQIVVPTPLCFGAFPLSPAEHVVRYRDTNLDRGQV